VILDIGKDATNMMTARKPFHKLRARR